MPISIEAAQQAAKAINAWLARPGRDSSPYYQARVDVLEVLDGQSGPLWLAHLFPAPGKELAFHALVFGVDAQGRARPAPGQRFLCSDLYPEDADTDQEIGAVASEGGAM